MAILGSGVQARSHPEALCRANTFQEVRAGSPQPSLWAPVDRICGKWILVERALMIVDSGTAALVQAGRYCASNARAGFTEGHIAGQLGPVILGGV